MASSDCSAAATLPPSGRRPMSSSGCSVRAASSAPARMRGISVTGIHTSDGKPMNVPLKPAGNTPTMVKVTSLSRTSEPTTSARPPRRRCQKPWLTTATAAERST